MEGRLCPPEYIDRSGATRNFQLSIFNCQTPMSGMIKHTRSADRRDPAVLYLRQHRMIHASEKCGLQKVGAVGYAALP